MDVNCQLTLFVVKDTANARQAIEDLTAVMDAHARGDYRIEVIDVLTEPERAETADIMATPTLICKTSSAETRIVGNLADRDQVARLLGLTA